MTEKDVSLLFKYATFYLRVEDKRYLKLFETQAEIVADQLVAMGVRSPVDFLEWFAWLSRSGVARLGLNGIRNRDTVESMRVMKERKDKKKFVSLLKVAWELKTSVLRKRVVDESDEKIPALQ